MKWIALIVGLLSLAADAQVCKPGQYDMLSWMVAVDRRR
jgi:hypothetical protein